MTVVLIATSLATAAPAKRGEIAESSFCQSLKFEGVALQEPGWHIWGCSPIAGEDGKVHLFVERWPVKGETCPRDFDEAWRHDSQIAHYVGDKPEGPYKLQDVALEGTAKDTWDRYAPANPCIQRIDGKYVLLYIANPIGVSKGIGRHPATQRIGMAVSKSLNGPWEKVGADGKILDPSEDPMHWTHGAQVVNPAFLKRGDGRYFLYFKGKGANMGVAIAEKMEGPYLHQPKKLSSNEVRVEDGYAFVMDGKIRLVTTDNAGSYGKGGGLLWTSDDGITFNNMPERGYHPPAHYLPRADASQTRNYYGAGTFQRPQVLVQNGKPTHLFVACGTVSNGGDGTICYVLSCRPEAVNRSSFKVMTFNILQGGANAANVGFPAQPRFAELARVINECGADIVGVQEDDASGRLLKALGGGWHRAGTIYSKFELEALTAGDFLSACRVKIPRTPGVVLVNAHWWPPKNSGVGLIQKRLREGTIPDDLAKFETEIVRASDASAGPRGYLRTLETLRAHMEKGENLILTGDFNESSHLDWTAAFAERGEDRWVKNPTGRPLRFKIEWKGSKLLADAGMKDAYRTVFPDEVARPGITWTPAYPPKTPGRRPYDDQVLERIDIIYFAGKGLRVSSAGVAGENKAACDIVHDGPWPSDHRAVVATFLVDLQ